MEDEITRLYYYSPQKEKYKTLRESTLLNAREFYKGRKIILIEFENDIFPLAKQYPSKSIGDWKEDEMNSTNIISEETNTLLLSVKRKRKKTEKETVLDKHDKIQESKPEESDDLDDLDDLDNTITVNDKIIDKKLFKKYFKCDSLGEMQADLYMTEGTLSNTIIENSIRNGLGSFKNDALNMTMDRLSTEKPFKVVITVSRINGFNKQNQEGQGLKILTPQQLLSRLAISLAQLKAGNNSEKLKNEIRQLLYSLYRSKKLSKTIYKHLMNTI